MSGYAYSDRQLRQWPRAAAAAALWERSRNLEEQANYWKAKAERLQAYLQAHECQENQ